MDSWTRFVRLSQEYMRNDNFDTYQIWSFNVGEGVLLHGTAINLFEIDV